MDLTKKYAEYIALGNEIKKERERLFCEKHNIKVGEDYIATDGTKGRIKYVSASLAGIVTVGWTKYKKNGEPYQYSSEIYI